ncbi:MaoC family dehydratase [Aquisalimonas sp.]|uniref:MaoC family dehydratase n=1 Tax=Aquisalimonas sp. TaxID=1872621 RepID=UPI0025C65C21|nr:MaoC family dehydratase [Aquisalimonas sp.]
MSQGYRFETLEVGMQATFRKTITEADIVNFAGVSSDFNPIHVDEEFASQTQFKGRIAHGMLSAAYISAVLGMQSPGPGAIYLDQSLSFRGSVRIGDSLLVRVELIDLRPDKNIVTFSTSCLVKGKPVVTGEAVVMVPSQG